MDLKTMGQTVNHQNKFSIAVEDQGGGETHLSISGRIMMGDFDIFTAEIERILRQQSPSSLTVDLAMLQYIDSAGALSLVQLETRARGQSIPVTYKNMSRETRGMMELIDKQSLMTPSIYSEKKRLHLFDRVGNATISFYDDLIDVMTFLGELLAAMTYCTLHPRSIRWGDVLFYMRKSGSEALPIVGLISLLMGLIMAFMSSLQLKQFGANLYVAALVGIAIVKELGPMMTAIVVAGRSGSAFAAEIGTMMVNEEVDALTTMGFDPVRFLAIPKIIATVLVVPLLTLYAILFGIMGGLLVGVIGLDLTFYTYIQQTMKHIQMFDVISSLVKSAVFAFLIAGIGCQRGFQVFGGAEAVGESTTSAVVSAIFLIVVTDSAFAIILHYAF
ncbi:MAG: MlaE family lipid ABC transporter permease subunit [Deltaproteobacteria bacterium]|nr:MlaE family lipid ABC transporter permease subunit [Deltaproteobacteria bacterium]